MTTVISKLAQQTIDKAIGTRVRAQRTLLGMSQTDLANGLGVTFQQVQKYEKGTNRISGSRLMQIGGVLKVEPAFLLSGSKQKVNGNGAANDEAFNLLNRSDAVRVLRAFTSIKSAKKRLAIANLIDVFANDD